MFQNFISEKSQKDEATRSFPGLQKGKFKLLKWKYLSFRKQASCWSEFLVNHFHSQPGSSGRVSILQNPGKLGCVGRSGGEWSNKKGKVTIGGIAAADLRSLYLHALLPERERGGWHIREEFPSSSPRWSTWRQAP